VEKYFTCSNKITIFSHKHNNFSCRNMSVSELVGEQKIVNNLKRGCVSQSCVNSH
jgi:hypothetical protein